MSSTEKTISPRPRLAYLVNRYPSVSHSFIRREIQELENQGFTVLRLALRGHDVVDDNDRREQALTHYILGSGATARLVGSAAAMVLSNPAGVLRALGAAFRLGRRADRPLHVQLIYLLEACAVARICRAHGIDHLHAHFGSNPAAIALLSSLVGGPRYSFTVHGPEEFDKPLTLKLAEKVAGSAFVVAISSFGRSQLLRWIDPSDRSKVEVVHCGLQADYARDTPPIGSNEDRFACIGRLSEQKGHVVLIEAFRLLKKRGACPRLVLVGDGDLRPEIERAIAGHGLESQIVLTGWGDEQAVRAAIIASRAMVLPSFAEGLPVVIMEAMALERPVITTYVAGIPELVRDGVDGLLVPAGDAAALADAVERLMTMDAAQLAEMGRTARERVGERHSIETEAGKLARLFEQSAGKPD